MNLDDLLNEMSEKIKNRDLSDEYLREHNNSTREEIGIEEYAYGITMIPCEWVYEYLSDYKRVLKENEKLKKFHIQDNKHLDFIMKNSITVQKVKAKIEELNIAISECEYLDDDDERYKKAVEKDKLCLLNQKGILKQLLEGDQ